MRETYGLHDVDDTRVRESGHFTDSGAELLAYDPGARWVTAEAYRPGDAVVLGMRCLHGSVRNQTADTLRLSCDVRYQPRADAFDDRWHVPYRGHGRFQDGEWLSSVGGESERCFAIPILDCSCCAWGGASTSQHQSLVLRAGVDQPGGGMRRDGEKTMDLAEAKRHLWQLKPAL
jgi:hypothetical protein